MQLSQGDLLEDQQGKRLKDDYYVYHSHLCQRSTPAYDGYLNVKGQNLEVGKILKTRQLSYFLDSELNYEVNLKYFQRYIVHFIEFFKIEKIVPKLIFENFDFLKADFN